MVFAPMASLADTVRWIYNPHTRTHEPIVTEDTPTWVLQHQPPDNPGINWEREGHRHHGHRHHTHYETHHHSSNDSCIEGAIVGGILGGVIGGFAASDDRVGIPVGAVTGGLVGCAIDSNN